MVKPALQGFAEAYATMGNTAGGVPMMKVAPGTGSVQANMNRLRQPTVIAGHGYLPLVRNDLFLTCTLDILFLRRGKAGDVYSAGDLDNRIKNLFDGLRLPEGNEPRPAGLDASPLFCLLEDDKLITSFSVRSDRLLTRGSDDESSVVLVIDVVVTPTRVKVELNSGFGWD